MHFGSLDFIVTISGGLERIQAPTRSDSVVTNMPQGPRLHRQEQRTPAAPSAVASTARAWSIPRRSVSWLEPPMASWKKTGTHLNTLVTALHHLLLHSHEGVGGRCHPLRQRRRRGPDVLCNHRLPPHRRGVTGARRSSNEPNSSLARRSLRNCSSSWSKNARHLSVSSVATPTGAPPARVRARSTTK
ncbi:hypothetical protein PVAP13_4KG244220 [Panicum virgatum]|uniref:Uncharacterized protein n=1 Tax=Panicum virgatum TaxID=38727 RepID=A0A8T0TSY8_PANVG|nr:hypothetical protein PVAP13_4KG244220 [Panicum virgatum]